MITRIGIVSGDILNLLETIQYSLTLKEIMYYLNDEADIIYMSLGWLTREGLIRMDSYEGTYIISRRDKDKPIPEFRINEKELLKQFLSI